MSIAARQDSRKQDSRKRDVRVTILTLTCLAVAIGPIAARHRAGAGGNHLQSAPAKGAHTAVAQQLGRGTRPSNALAAASEDVGASDLLYDQAAAADDAADSVSQSTLAAPEKRGVTGATGSAEAAAVQPSHPPQQHRGLAIEAG